MTLEEAIKHCKDIALTCTNKECALDHFQLLKWLQEYSNMLEKQGEKKPAVIIPKFRIGDEIKTSNEESLTITKIDEKGYWSEDLFICSFDEECIWDWTKQKPADNVEPKFDNIEEVNFFEDFRNTDSEVEPKFKVGDWVVRGKTIVQILDIQDQYYVGLDIDGNDFTSSISDDKIHFWTIKDAKLGDVLVHNDCTFIFMGIKDGIVQALEENLLYVSFGEPSKDNDYQPATKEQRNTLFAKMKEAGYEWDAEKKELKKIKKNTAWSEEDNYNLQCCIAKVQSDIDNGRIGRNRELLNWLESLKDRCAWKPSEEQLRELHCVISGCSFETPVLVELEKDLKKLRGE